MLASVVTVAFEGVEARRDALAVDIEPAEEKGGQGRGEGAFNGNAHNGPETGDFFQKAVNAHAGGQEKGHPGEGAEIQGQLRHSGGGQKNGQKLPQGKPFPDFEMSGVSETLAREAFKRQAYKLPIKTCFARRRHSL